MATKITCIDCEIASCAVERLSSEELFSMESVSHQIRFSKGEVIRKQGAPTNTVIYLRSGYVKEYMAFDNEPDQVIQLFKPRSYIGLKSICSESESFFSYQAVSDVDLCFIDKNTFSELIQNNGKFAEAILASLCRETVSNQKRFLSLNQTQIFGKVAGLLIYLSGDIYENAEFDLMLTRAELAQMVASTRESVTKAMKWFHNERIIDMQKNRIRIIDEKRLSELAKRG